MTRMTDRRLSILAFLLIVTLAPTTLTADDPPRDVDAPPSQIDLPGEIERLDFDDSRMIEVETAHRLPPIDLDYELAGQFIRNASGLLKNQPLTMQAIEIAMMFSQEAVDLAPEDVEAWYYLLSVATLAERDDLAGTAIDRLAELDGKNDIILLRQLRSEIERSQTAAERAAHYEREIARTDLPASVRSRLALDLAILERRRGRTESFATWLAESVSLDRAHTAAAALAAGYFRLYVDDPVGTGELLLNQSIANPADISAQMLAANHFLNHGAYDVADRLYTLAKTSYQSLVRAFTPGELIADLAIARWGAGRTDDALQVIRAYQRKLDKRHRDRLLFAEPHLTPMERAERHAVLPRAVEVVHAAILARRSDEEGAAAIKRVLELHERLIDEGVETARLEGQELDSRMESEIAQLWLEAAWLTVWFGPNPAEAERYLQRANSILDVSERAEQRIAGWIALREGNYDAAVDLLQPLAVEDSAAALGYANALLAQGRQRSAAQEFLRIVRSQPGTLIGVWAGDQLTELLGSRSPISNQAAMLDSFMDNVPRYYDRLPANPTAAFTLRLRPVKRVYRPYEPILIDLEIINHTARPLAIDSDGPILPDVALLLDVRVSGIADPVATDPIIVNINRRLRLEPHERLTIALDLRRTVVGGIVDQHALRGTIVTIRAVSNFYITPDGAILPGLLGSEHRAAPINIEGKRLSADIVNKMFTEVIRQPDRTIAPDMAILLHFLVGYSYREMSNAEMQSLIRSLLAIGRAYRELDPVMQTWLLMTLPTRTAVIRPLLEVARQSDHRLVILAMLFFGRHAIDEADLRALLEHDDDRLRRYARILTDSPEEVDILIIDESADDQQSLLDSELPQLHPDDSD